MDISTTALKDKNGTITYLKGFPNMQSAAVGAGAGGELKGVFAFSFYVTPFRGEYDDEQAELYLKGIQIYLGFVKYPRIQYDNGDEEVEEENPFYSWKVVVYTDQQTYDYLKDKQANLVKDPDVDFAIVDWPYYSREEKGQVNGDVLRVMRFRAFFDFNKVPVFVRDADTLWVTGEGKKVFNGGEDTIHVWELNFYKGAVAQDKPYIFGTSQNYIERWHENTLTKVKAPLGAYAGLQSLFPGAPCFQDLTLWDKAMDYILSRSVYNKTTQKYSNNRTNGKDEQILLYVFLPACFDSIFFFELYMNLFISGKNPNKEKHESIKKVLRVSTFTKNKYPIDLFSEKGKILEETLKKEFSTLVKPKTGGRRMKQTKRRQQHKKRKSTRRKL